MQTQSKQLDFSGQNFYCGIDVHKKTWAVTIETEDIVLKTFTQDSDPESLIKYLRRNYPGGTYIAGYEAGYFGFNLHRQFKERGIDCLVINPADVPTSYKEKDQKRDPIDSRKIARAIRTGEAKAIWVPSVALEQDRQLMRTRRIQTKDQTRVKNRIKAFLQMHGIKYPESFNNKQSHWSRRFIDWLEQIKLEESSGTEALQSMVRNLKFIRNEILIVAKRIRLLSQNDRYQQNFLKLIKIPGIGLLTGMIILTEVGDITRFKNADKFRSFIGFIPRSSSSGEKDYRGRITNRGCLYLRALLTESAWITVQNDPYYLHLYNHYKKRMKPNKAIVRTAVKLTNQIYYTLKIEETEEVV
jgi:transposase